MADIPPRQQVNGSETIRVDQSGGLPHYDDPYAHQPQPPYGDVPPGYGAVVPRNESGAGDGAYAILKVFQDYMERERQRAQRRTNTVIVAFAALFAIVSAGFFAIWFSTMHGMQGTQNDLIRAALAAREDTGSKADVAAAISAALEKAAEGQRATVEAAIAKAELAAREKAASEAAMEERARTEKEFEARLEAERKAADERLAAERAASDARLEAEREAAKKAARLDAERDATIDGLKAAIEALKKDNENLRSETAKASARQAAKPVPAAAATTAPQPPTAPTRPSSTTGRTTAPGKPAAADRPATAARAAAPVVAPQGKAIVAEVSPEITIKRPAPPKGFSTESVVLPVGKDRESQVSWHLLMPDTLPKE